MQGLEADVALLQQRISRAATVSEALELFTNPPEGTVAPDPALIQELTILIQASGDPELQTKWAEIAGAIFATAGPPPFELVGELARLVQASGDAQIQEKFQEFASGAIRGEVAGPALELATLIRASADQALQAKMQQLVQAVVKDAELPGRLFEEFAALALASGNEEVTATVRQLAALPPEFLTAFETKVRAVGDQSLDAQLEDLFTPGLGAERHAIFLRSLVAAQVAALK